MQRGALSIHSSEDIAIDSACRGNVREVYDLYGVISQPRQGVESAFCVLSLDRRWWKFQDIKVTMVSEFYLDSVKPWSRVRFVMRSSMLVFIRRYQERSQFLHMLQSVCSR